jgi:uncharacterized membrane protein
MQRYLTVGLAALAGVALFEAALIPGVIIGAAAVLAPNLLAPKSRRRARPRSHASADRRDAPRFSLPALFSVKPASAAPSGLSIRQAVAKTITFRIIVTTLDFSTNYLVIGELGTAAGLSAFALVAGPIFYLVHETAWNRFGPSEGAVALPALRVFRTPAGGFTINRALAKTITFRTIATVMDFTATYVVVGDVATAAGLSAFGFVFGPFVYLGHEMLWDRYGWLAEPKDVSPRPMKLLPAPA